MKKVAVLCVLVFSLALIPVASSGAAQDLPEGCTKFKGTVTCTTTDGPGNNQGGVGTVETDETKGNTTNKNPEPQDLQEDCDKRPAGAQGDPIGDCPA
jgi:hypothetical protein